MPRIERGDRRELSKLVALLQEAERLEGEGERVDLARLKKLEQEVADGTYEIELQKLAEAMLPSMEDFPGLPGSRGDEQ